MNKWSCPLIAAALFATLAAVVLRFSIVGNTVPSPDGRVAVVLNPAERDLVLTEMRALLSGVQAITSALTRKDMETVARNAELLGMQSAQEVPLSLKGKLPLEFKRLGFSVHQDFDHIAADARAIGSVEHTYAQLGDTLAKCVACHAGHRLIAQ